MNLNTANTILYCRRWEETVRFYRDGLGLPVVFATDWFVEFCLAADSRLSIADDARATVRSSGGAGITLSLQVEDIQAEHTDAERAGLEPTAIRAHPWRADTFYLFDPEGHRIEIWQRTK
jgi:catechol 2,3-dioxygenase-like lactoylglutathione lyase family enzyme